MQKIKVLLAQTDSEIVTIISTVMKRENFNITTVANGNEAIQKIGAEKFDIIICDLIIPGASGSEVASRTRLSKFNADSIFTLLTGDRNPNLIGELFSLNKIDSYVPKPVTFRQITEHIRMMLNTTRSRHIQIKETTVALVLQA